MQQSVFSQEGGQRDPCQWGDLCGRGTRIADAESVYPFLGFPQRRLSAGVLYLRQRGGLESLPEFRDIE